MTLVSFSQLFDWLTGEIDEASGVKARSEVFASTALPATRARARACAGRARARELDEMASAASDAEAAAARCARSGATARRRASTRCGGRATTSARARFAEAEAALVVLGVVPAVARRRRPDARAVADAQRAAGGSRDHLLARDAIVRLACRDARRLEWLHEQLWQRLEPFVESDEAPGVARRARRRARAAAEGLALRAVSASPGFEPAGGALRATLEGHAWEVSGGRVLRRGRRVVRRERRGQDGTLVGRRRGGAPLLVLEHETEVNAVARYGKGDERRIVSACRTRRCACGTHRAGKPLLVLVGHTDSVIGVVTCHGGGTARRIVSGGMTRRCACGTPSSGGAGAAQAHTR